jgi:hypothetical protein
MGISLSSADMAGARRAFAMYQKDMLAPVEAPHFKLSRPAATQATPTPASPPLFLTGWLPA